MPCQPCFSMIESIISSLLVMVQCKTLTGSRYVCFFGKMRLVRVKNITFGGLVRHCIPKLPRGLFAHAETPTRPRTSIIPRRHSPAWHGSARMGSAILLLRSAYAALEKKGANGREAIIIAEWIYYSLDHCC